MIIHGQAIGNPGAQWIVERLVRRVHSGSKGQIER